MHNDEANNPGQPTGQNANQPLDQNNSNSGRMDAGHSNSLGYETRDVAIFTLARWLLVLFIFISGTSLIVLVLYYLFVPRGADAKAGFPTTAVRQLPPPDAPILQANPVRDIQEYRTDEEAKLTRYTMLDAKRGLVKIPIDLAMRLTAERGAKPLDYGPSVPAPDPAPASDSSQERRQPAPNGGLPDSLVPSDTDPAAPRGNGYDVETNDTAQKPDTTEK